MLIIKLIKVFIKKILFASFLLLLSLTFPSKTYAQNLFSDDFETGEITDKWTYISGTWTREIFNSTTWARVNSGSGSDNEIQAGNLLWMNYNFNLDIFKIEGEDINLFFRIQNARYLGLFDHDLPVSYGLHLKHNRIALQKFTPNTGAELQVVTNNVPFLNSTLKHLTIRLESNNIKVFIDNSATPIIDYTDNDQPFLNGGIAIGSITGSAPQNVRYDNVVVSELLTGTAEPSASPTPTLEPSPVPTATASATPIATTGPFELPFSYPNRLNSTTQEFKNAFYDKMTALFDHVFLEGFFRPFTGNTYTGCSVPLSCYDSHNGTDFDNLGTDGFAYSVSNGKVVYTSKPEDNCANDTTGYGCSVIVRYNGSLYGLYAHLAQILVYEGQDIFTNTQIGVMGESGSATGDHLHFGLLKPVNDKLTSSSTIYMKNKDWKNLLDQVSNAGKLPRFKPYCTYKAPTGVSFAFQDPSGWFGQDKDPWSLSKAKNGCGITSPYLWKYSIL